jgi:hypothetical protein
MEMVILLTAVKNTVEVVKDVIGAKTVTAVAVTVK